MDTRLTRVCINCGVEKPLAAFLQMTGTQGTVYGNICATCRAHLSREMDEEGSGKSGTFRIDSNAKVATELQQKEEKKKLKEEHLEDKKIREKSILEKLERKDEKEKGEKYHREQYVQPAKKEASQAKVTRTLFNEPRKTQREYEAAPAQVGVSSSIQYLKEISILLERTVKEMISGRDSIQWIKKVAQEEQALRDQYKVKDKFRFVRDKIQNLLNELESEHFVEKSTSQPAEAEEDEVTLYVYLYNAHGIHLNSWQNMLLPKAFYEHSVNRPIYSEKGHVEALIRSKKNKSHHAYIILKVKRAHVIDLATAKDSLGNPLARVKEGALYFEKVIAFSHNGQDFVIDESGELVIAR